VLLDENLRVELAVTVQGAEETVGYSAASEALTLNDGGAALGAKVEVVGLA